MKYGITLVSIGKGMALERIEVYAFFKINQKSVLKTWINAPVNGIS